MHGQTACTAWGKPYHAIANWHLSIVSEKNWNTKEDKGKSMMHALYALWLAKRDISGQSDISGWSDIKQWRNQAHSPSIVE